MPATNRKLASAELCVLPKPVTGLRPEQPETFNHLAADFLKRTYHGNRDNRLP